MLQSFAALLRDFLTSNNEEIASIYKKWAKSRVKSRQGVFKVKNPQVARFTSGGSSMRPVWMR